MIENETNDYYIPTKTGDYFTIFNSPICGTDTSNKIHVVYNGINEINETESFNIYPNPAYNDITIETPQSSGESILSIYNINGQELLKQNITTNKTQIDISGLSKGVYFVKLANEKTVTVKKIIKN